MYIACKCNSQGGKIIRTNKRKCVHPKVGEYASHLGEIRHDLSPSPIPPYTQKQESKDHQIKAHEQQR